MLHHCDKPKKKHGTHENFQIFTPSPPPLPPFLKNFRIWHKHLVLTLLSLDHGHIGISTAGGIFLAHSTSSPRQKTPATTMEIPRSLGEKINAQCIAMETRQGNELPAEAKLGLWFFFFDRVNSEKVYRICLLTWTIVWGDQWHHGNLPQLYGDNFLKVATWVMYMSPFTPQLTISEGIKSPFKKHLVCKKNPPLFSPNLGDCPRNQVPNEGFHLGIRHASTWEVLSWKKRRCKFQWWLRWKKQVQPEMSWGDTFAELPQFFFVSDCFFQSQDLLWFFFVFQRPGFWKRIVSHYCRYFKKKNA